MKRPILPQYKSYKNRLEYEPNLKKKKSYNTLIKLISSSHGETNPTNFMKECLSIPDSKGINCKNNERSLEKKSLKDLVALESVRLYIGGLRNLENNEDIVFELKNLILKGSRGISKFSMQDLEIHQGGNPFFQDMFAFITVSPGEAAVNIIRTYNGCKWKKNSLLRIEYIKKKKFSLHLPKNHLEISKDSCLKSTTNTIHHDKNEKQILKIRKKNGRGSLIKYKPGVSHEFDVKNDESGPFNVEYFDLILSSADHLKSEKKHPNLDYHNSLITKTSELKQHQEVDKNSVQSFIQTKATRHKNKTKKKINEKHNSLAEESSTSTLSVKNELDSIQNHNSHDLVDSFVCRSNRILSCESFKKSEALDSQKKNLENQEKNEVIKHNMPVENIICPTDDKLLSNQPVEPEKRLRSIFEDFYHSEKEPFSFSLQIDNSNTDVTMHNNIDVTKIVQQDYKEKSKEVENSPKTKKIFISDVLSAANRQLSSLYPVNFHDKFCQQLNEKEQWQSSREALTKDYKRKMKRAIKKGFGSRIHNCLKNKS